MLDFRYELFVLKSQRLNGVLRRISQSLFFDLLDRHFGAIGSGMPKQLIRRQRAIDLRMLSCPDDLG